jgi:hypothetical protein
MQVMLNIPDFIARQLTPQVTGISRVIVENMADRGTGSHLQQIQGGQQILQGPVCWLP